MYTHILFSIILFLFINAVFLRYNNIFALLVALFSLVPDIDYRIGWHRKLTHNIFFLFIILLFINTYTLRVLFFIGFISHIIGDMLSGCVYFFWPLFNKCFSLKP